MKNVYSFAFILFIVGSQPLFAQFNDDNNCSPGINSPAWNPDKHKDWKRAVFRFSPGGNYCTATLINQTGSGRPRQLMITARHCIRSGEYGAGPIINYNPTTRIIDRAQLIFNFESPDGNNNTIPNDLAPTGFASNQGTRDPDHRITEDFRYPLISDVRLLYETPISVLNLGVGVDASANGRDIAILEILTPIPSHYNVNYIGWYPGLDLALFAPPFSMIQHPSADTKKLARAPVFIPITTPRAVLCRRVTRVIDFFLSLFRTRWVSETICNAIDIGQFVLPAFSVGASRGGSSGSPLLTTNGKLIGIFSANLFDQECNLAGPNTFGKFQNVYSDYRVRRELNPNFNELVNNGHRWGRHYLLPG